VSSKIDTFTDLGTGRYMHYEHFSSEDHVGKARISKRPANRNPGQAFAALAKMPNDFMAGGRRDTKPQKRKARYTFSLEKTKVHRAQAQQHPRAEVR
jgi:hypothetical protein